jgi:hypothetical protein
MTPETLAPQSVPRDPGAFIKAARAGTDLAKAVKALAELPASAPALDRVRLAQAVATANKLAIEARIAAGLSTEAAPEAEGSDEAPPVEGKKSTAEFYSFDEIKSKGARQKANNAAVELLRTIQAEGRVATPAEKAILAKYSGSGGGLERADGRVGSAYEYYTPKPIADAMWSLLGEMGFSGGAVLDPCAGTGIFGGTSPKNALVDAVELDEVSGAINRLVNDGPGNSVTVSNFEKVAVATPDESYDAIITNVPFGDVSARGANAADDPAFEKEDLETYFILRSLRKLRPGGLAAFVVSPQFVGKPGSGSALANKIRTRASLMAEFMGAYRLPNKVFGAAAADTITDVVVFQKHSAEVAQKIAEVQEQNPDALSTTNVLWEPFITGRYFQSDEGRRYQLGEFVAKSSKFRDVDRVVNDDSIPNIARLLRKFPGSRIDFTALEATPTEPIMILPGDVRMIGGQQMEYTEDGEWVPAGRDVVEAAREAEIVKIGPSLATPHTALLDGVTYQAAMDYVRLRVSQGNNTATTIPNWVRTLYSPLQAMGETEAAASWLPIVAGLSVEEVIGTHEAGRNYSEEFPRLTSTMATVYSLCKNPPKQLSAKVRGAMRTLTFHYSPAAGYSAFWTGKASEAAQVDADRNPYQVYEAVRYGGAASAMADGFVAIDGVREALGDRFSINDPDWIPNADGTGVLHADDFYTGNYGEVLARLKAMAGAAATPELAAKFAQCMADAESRVMRVNVRRMKFDLFTPYVSIEDKVAFMQRFVSPFYTLGFGDDGEKRIIWGGRTDTDEEKLFNRFAFYLSGDNSENRSGRGSISLLSSKLDMSNEEAFKRLMDMERTAKAQFDSFVKASPSLIGAIEARFSRPEALFFRDPTVEYGLNVPGLRTDTGRTLHPYQGAFARKMARRFNGGNAFDVGLGKTFTALASVQHVHNIGAKRCTIFAVPGSVLGNWRKEAAETYQSIDDCLFVGLRFDKAGQPTVDPGKFDEDLNAILSGKYRKVFMTHQAFQRLKVKPETIEAYLRDFVRTDLGASPRSEGDFQKLQAYLVDIRKKADKSNAAPYFETLGVDSVVLDEAHVYKNARKPIGFKSAKFLSLADPSALGMDALMKCWWLRGNTPFKDGVLPLTATPITNSPAEIFTMLSLANGDDHVNAAMGGITGMTEFLEAMCRIEQREDPDMIGERSLSERPRRIFEGLDNLGVLRTVLHSTYTVMSADEANLKLPEPEESPTRVTLDDDTVADLNLFKLAYHTAKCINLGKDNMIKPGGQAALEEVKALTNEPVDLIGHPFNLIKKMSGLVADRDYGKGYTAYSITPGQESDAQELVDAFNAKKVKEDRPARHTQLSTDAEIIKRNVKKDAETGEQWETWEVHVKAQIKGGRILIDTTDFDSVEVFEQIAEKSKASLDVSMGPKLAAFIENFKMERANPGYEEVPLPDGTYERRRRKLVKQLVFVDLLGLQHKVKRLIAKHCGVSTSKIAIVNGSTGRDAEQMQRFQDDFNAEGDENKIEVIVANEKAEVGANFQKGTQAIHHLTIGWTPDSIHQRNGRGVRQGNRTTTVRVYHYDADGTFDQYKRHLVGKKADWIGAVMKSDSADSVLIGGQLSAEDADNLIECVGDATAMDRINAMREAREQERRAADARAKQLIHWATVEAQSKVANEGISPILDKRVRDLWARGFDLTRTLADDQARLNRILTNGTEEDAKSNKTARLKAKIATAEQALAKVGRLLDNAFGGQVAVPGEWVYVGGRSQQTQETRMSAIEYLKREAFAKGYQRMKHRDAEKFVGSLPLSMRATSVQEGSEIHTDAVADVDTAANMVQESIRSFKDAAKEADGAMHADMIDDLATGNAQRIGDRVYRTGQVVEIGGGRVLGVIGVKTGLYIQRAEGAKAAPEFRLLSSANLSQIDRVIDPTDADYEQALRRVAAIDDAVLAGGFVGKGEGIDLLTDALPAAAKYLTVKPRTAYRLRAIKLPAPYFSRIISELPMSGLIARLAEEQQQVVESVEVSGGWGQRYMAAKAGGALVGVDLSGDEDRYTEDLIAELMARADAESYQFTAAEFLSTQPMARTLRDAITRRARTACLSVVGELGGMEFTTKDEALAWLERRAVELCPFFDLAGVKSASPHYFGSFVGYEAERVALSRVKVDQGQKPVLPPSPAEAAGNISALQLIDEARAVAGPYSSGKLRADAAVFIKDRTVSTNKFASATYTLKDTIKAKGAIHGGYAWNGDRVGWIIPLAAYEALVNDEALIEKMRKIKVEAPK